ncbi:hypothetical protein SLA_0162 [Streptomyces laurentii]|uniref:Uncharacterized protein n=1 Tax=Streptomyces laurentii TaxID=39478 RepID=A0A160NS47_STRLU|nr:hypothetical protein SLA_0162 [Streptomyces laurentii]
MDLRAPVPSRRLGPYALTDDGIAVLLAHYEFHDAGIRRVIIDQEFGWEPRGRVVRLVIDARVRDEGHRWEPVCLDLAGVRRFRIDESPGAPAGVLVDAPRFTRFDGLIQVDLCAERFGSLRPRSGQEVFEGSEWVFEAVEGTWSVLEPWSV